jgi:hypothetical protein
VSLCVTYKKRKKSLFAILFTVSTQNQSAAIRLLLLVPLVFDLFYVYTDVIIFLFFCGSASFMQLKINEKYLIYKCHKQNLSRAAVFVVQLPTSGLRRLTVEGSRSYTIRHTHTRTHAWAPLGELSARRRGRYIHNTLQTREMDIMP